ncbi:plasminogen-like [Saccoglossus kowalevskii]
MNGEECAIWTSDNTHQHGKTPENYPDSGLGDHNYCRNPDGDMGAWCYTTNLDIPWEFCNIGPPREDCSATTIEPNETAILTTPYRTFSGETTSLSDVNVNTSSRTNAEHECYTRADGSDYRGLVHVTSMGINCQKWSSQSPHPHNRLPYLYPNAGLGDHNYCRNPDGEMGVWCYTMNPDIRRQQCSIGNSMESCGNGECFVETDGSDYRGLIQKTVHGKLCQKWTAQYPHSHNTIDVNFPNSGLGDHNYCRNPDREIGVWCYTTDVNTRKELCDIGEPSDTCGTTIQPGITTTAIPSDISTETQGEGSTTIIPMLKTSPIPKESTSERPSDVVTTANESKQYLIGRHTSLC